MPSASSMTSYYTTSYIGARVFLLHIKLAWRMVNEVLAQTSFCMQSLAFFMHFPPSNSIHYASRNLHTAHCVALLWSVSYHTTCSVWALLPQNILYLLVSWLNQSQGLCQNILYSLCGALGPVGVLTCGQRLTALFHILMLKEVVHNTLTFKV